MNIPQKLKGVLSCDPEIMGGAICFTGTRIQVVMLLVTSQPGIRHYFNA